MFTSTFQSLSFFICCRLFSNIYNIRGVFIIVPVPTSQLSTLSLAILVTFVPHASMAAFYCFLHTVVNFGSPGLVTWHQHLRFIITKVLVHGGTAALPLPSIFWDQDRRGHLSLWKTPLMFLEQMLHPQGCDPEPREAMAPGVQDLTIER